MTGEVKKATKFEIDEKCTEKIGTTFHDSKLSGKMRHFEAEIEEDKRQD